MNHTHVAMYDKIHTRIRQHGWVVIGTEPMISYTIGLTGKGRPELILRGVGYDLATAVLNGMATQAINGGGLQPDTDYTIKGILGILRVTDIPWGSAASPIRGGAIMMMYPRSDIRLQEIRHHNMFASPEAS